MTKWNMVIDVDLCENCNNCFLATKDETVGNEFPGYSAPQPLHGHRWIDIKRKVRGTAPMVDAAHVPTMCNHCDDAPCLKKGGDAVTKRADGIVLIDPVKAKGRKDLVDACPYGSIWWNEELQLPQAWTFDAHLLDQGWTQPRGAHACPTGAMRAFKLTDDERAAKIKAEGLEELRPDLNTKPRVWYKNLQRYNKCFVGGSVVANAGGVTDCVEGADVELLRNGTVIARSRSDTFGDFKFDGIVPGSGGYSVAVSHATFGKRTVDVDVGEDSVAIGEIRLG